jgi:uncharacterized protein DUF5658
MIMRKRREDSLESAPIGERTQRIGTLQHFRWLRGIVASVLVLNLLDAIFTIVVVVTHRASEANPMMADLVHNDPWLFMIVKLTLVSLGSYLLWRLRKRAFAVLAIFLAFFVYYLVLLYHLSAMDLRLLSRIAS